MHIILIVLSLVFSFIQADVSNISVNSETQNPELVTLEKSNNLYCEQDSDCTISASSTIKSTAICVYNTCIEETTNPGYKEYKTYTSSDLGISFEYPEFFQKIEENSRFYGYPALDFICTDSTDDTQFFTSPQLVVGVVENKSINDTEYTTDNSWQKPVANWEIDGLKATYIINSEAAPFEKVVIEHPTLDNAVIELTAHSGLMNSKNYIVNMYHIAQTIKTIEQ